MRRVLLGLAAVLVGLGFVLAARTATFRSRQLKVTALRGKPVDQGASERLAAAVRYRTVSYQSAPRLDAGQFLELHRYLRDAFPEVHRVLARELVAQYSLLYVWKGSDPTLPPLLLLGHLDVVPVEPSSEAAWTYPPFAGQVADGYVWGRGAMDDKAGVLGTLEAVEHLLGAGFRPRRTVLLAFGHDEEVGGRRGAARMATLLGGRGIRPVLVLDEGLPIVEGVVPGIPGPVAMVGTAEKGYLSLELVVHSEGGHSSTPPRDTAVGILATAVSRLERAPFPPAVAGATAELFAFLGPELPLLPRVAFANLWLFRGMVEHQLAASPATDALIRTTIAPTMLEGSVKENVLPTRARAVVNFRIRPGETTASVLAHVQRAVDDERVVIKPFGPVASEPSPETPTDAPAFRRVQRTIGQIFPDVVVTPGLVLGATDARHYAALGGDVVRFLPLRATADDVSRPHGTDERIGVAVYEDMVRFYRQLIRNFDAPD